MPSGWWRNSAGIGKVRLAKITAACQRRPCDAGTIERRVGRLLGKNTRAAGLFTVTVARAADGRAALHWTRRPEAEDWSRLAFVQFRGRASLLHPGAAEHGPAVAALREKYAQYLAMALEALPLIEIEVERVVAWRAS